MTEIIKYPFIIFLVVICTYFSSLVGIMNSGDGTQYALIRSVLDLGKLNID